MTIVAGFKSFEGIVVCADTQETIDNLSKRDVPKLRFEPEDSAFYGARGHEGDGLAVAFCGAGENGPFIDKLIDNAWHDAKNTTALPETCEAIEESIKDTYREFGKIFQVGFCPQAELIYGVKMEGRSKLFSAMGPVVNEERTYSTAGIGRHLADFLAARMHGDHLNIRQCAILAAYVLFQTKEHIEGCGGDSHIAVLRNNGTSGKVGSRQVQAITELLKITDKDSGRIFLELADFEINDEEFKKDGNFSIDVLQAMRKSVREELKESIEQWDALFPGRLSGPKRNDDWLGLPKSPDDTRAI